MTSTHAARHSCLARNNDWRRHAQHLRDLAIRQHLSQESRERLLLDATIADACAVFLRNNHDDVGASCRTYPNDLALRSRLLMTRRR